MINPCTIWLLLALAFFLTEALVPGVFYFLSFAIGAVFTSVTLLFFSDLCLLWQLLVALSVSILSFLLLVKIVEDKKLSVSEQRHAQSNIDALPGLKVLVLEHIAHEGVGTVKLEGEVWSGKNLGEALAPGDKALVVKVEGNKLFIKKVDRLKVQ